MSEFMTVVCFDGSVGGSLNICKRFTGDYMVSCQTEEEGVIDVLFEGTKSKSFDFILERIKKFHEEHCVQ